MVKFIKNKAFTIALVIMFFMVQVLTGTSMVVKAEGASFEVSVQVQSHDKVITTGTSTKTNGFEALKEVLNKNSIPIVATDGTYGKFISEVNGVTGGKFGGYDGWLYAISRNNSYVDISVGIDAATLQSGDKLILYYGDMGTVTANKIVFSTQESNKELTISLNNTYVDWATNEKVIQPINDVKAKIDGVDVTVVDNKITIIEGLSKGIHTLVLNDFNADSSPKVVCDEIKFTIGGEETPGNGDSEGSESADNTKILKTIDETLISATSILKVKGIETWSAMSLNKLGEKVDTTFLKESMEDIKANGVKDISNTDMEKLIMGLAAAGYTPYNFQGYNLVSELFGRDISSFLINDAVFGIFAYNYANIKEDYNINKDKLVSIILKSMLSYEKDGARLSGWTYYGDKIDPDMTGAAINALSEYYNTKSEVKKAIDDAVATLSILQSESGYSVSQYGLASEATAFTILGLTSLGINPEGEDFTKAKGDLVSALLSFKSTDGGFKHLVEDTTSNYISTEQGLRALIAIKEFKTSGKYNFYTSDINSKNLPVFVLSNNASKDDKVTNVSKDKLPQTGSFADTNVLIILGALFMAIGVFYLRKIKVENK